MCELEIVLILAFDQFGNFDVLLVILLLEAALEKFVVGDIISLHVSSPFDLAEWESARIDGVEDLAVDCSSTKLFDLGQTNLIRSDLAYLEQIIDPLENLHLGDGVGHIHHAYRVCHNF